MCNPAAILAAVQIAKTGFEYVDSQNQADRVNENAEQTATNARQAAVHQFSGNIRRSREEEIAASVEAQRIQKAANLARATSRTSAAESGITGGLSLDALMADFVRNEQESLFLNQQNLGFRKLQLQEQQLGISTQAQNRVNQADASQIYGDSPIAAGLSMAASVAGAHYSNSLLPTAPPDPLKTFGVGRLTSSGGVGALSQNMTPLGSFNSVPRIPKVGSFNVAY